MPIVTLTTDFGWRDYYPAMIKGAMLCAHPQLTIVDITHSIKNYDIVQAAFLFKNAWQSFPEGTIHLISVKDYYAPRKRFLATAAKGHYFIAPDNGLFSLIFDEEMPPHFYELDYEEGSPFPLQDAYAQAVGYLAHGRPLIEIGLPAQDIERRITLQPVIGHSQIRGSVIYVDNYDNAITNVTRELFEKVGGGRSFKLFFKRHAPIKRLSQDYHDRPVGEPLCLFNSAGYLEIAINMGRASTLFGLERGGNHSNRFPLMIKRIVKLTFQPDKADDFLALFSESKSLILNYPGCRHLELLRCTEPDNVFFTYSFWEDAEALDGYRQSELFRSTWSRTKKLFAGKPQAWTTVEWEE